MGAMSFPSSPVPGQVYEKWYWDDTAGEWKLSPVSTTTLWSEGEDDKIYYNTGEVGVGTSEPTRDLVIFNSAGPVLQITDQGAGNVNSDGLQLKQLSANSEVMNKEAGNLVLGTDDTARLTIDATGDAMFSGNVAVGRYDEGATGTNVTKSGTVLLRASTGAGSTAPVIECRANNDSVTSVITSKGDATFSGTVNAPTLALGNWKIELEGNNLVFKYNNTKVAKMETSGKFISKNDLRAFGTP